MENVWQYLQDANEIRVKHEISIMQNLNQMMTAMRLMALDFPKPQQEQAHGVMKSAMRDIQDDVIIYAREIERIRAAYNMDEAEPNYDLDA